MIYRGELGGVPVEILSINGVKKITYADDGTPIENQDYWVHELNILINRAMVTADNTIEVTDNSNDIVFKVWL